MDALSLLAFSASSLWDATAIVIEDGKEQKIEKDSKCKSSSPTTVTLQGVNKPSVKKESNLKAPCPKLEKIRTVKPDNCASEASCQTMAHIPALVKKDLSMRPSVVVSSGSETAASSENETTVHSIKPIQVKSNVNVIVPDFNTPRPKRASATAARSFLQKVLHSPFGNIEESKSNRVPGSSDKTPKKSGRRPRSTKQIIEDATHAISKKLENVTSSAVNDDQVDNARSQSKRRKRRRKDTDEEKPKKRPMNSDKKIASKRGSKPESDADKPNAVESDDDSFLEFMDEETGGVRSKPSAAFAHFVNNSLLGGKEISSQKWKAPPQRRKRKCLKNSSVTDSHPKRGNCKSNLAGKESSETEDSGPKELVDPKLLTEGSRVLIEYRNNLYQATVKKTRLRQESHDYLVHYDGNKKSNVHWVPLEKIRKSLPGNSEDLNVEKAKKIKEKSSTAEKVTTEKVTTEKVTTEKVTSEKVTSEKVTSEKVTSEKVTKESNTSPQKKSPGRPPKTEAKFSKGSEVYVEYKSVLYTATVRNTRKKKVKTEYFMHYDGFKKSADRWLQESALHEINAITTRRYKKLRNETDDESETEEDPENPEEAPCREKKTREYDLCDIVAGVAFLPGSCVFVKWNDALYLARMLKRRYRTGDTEYLVTYNGHNEKWDSWVALSTVYEINPKTRRIFEKEKKDEPPGTVQEPSKTFPQKKEAIKEKPQASNEKPKSTKEKPKSTKEKPKTEKDTPSSIDMDNIDSGVQFLPGSTLFVHVKTGIYLAKMLKRRGMGDHMEYLIQYNGYKRNAETWAPVSTLYEINPQTKRVFNKQKK